jgi:hypothetical protein
VRDALSVNDGTEGGLSTALGTGSVKFEEEATLNAVSLTDTADVTTFFGYLTVGNLNVTSITGQVKPSQLAGISGISATKQLIAKATAPEDARVLDIPVGAEITTAPGDKLGTNPGTITVKGTLVIGDKDAALGGTASISVIGNGVLDIGANIGLGTSTNTDLKITTEERGVVKSATATSTALATLLAKAGNSLHIEQRNGVLLEAATNEETTVKAGTTLSITNGTITADNAATKTLVVQGTVILEGGLLTTGGTPFATATPDPNAIKIVGNGRIVAGDIVISGEGALYEATGGKALPISISAADGFVASTAASIVTLVGQTTVNAGNGKVVLSVDGGAATETGTFKVGASPATLKITADGTTATIALSNKASALTIGAKGSLTVGENGIIELPSNPSDFTLDSGGAGTEKLSFAKDANVKVGGNVATADAAFDPSTKKITSGTFAAAVAYKGASSNQWALDN